MGRVFFNISILVLVLASGGCSSLKEMYNENFQGPPPPEPTITDKLSNSASTIPSTNIDARLNAITSKLVEQNCSVQIPQGVQTQFQLRDLVAYTSCSKQRIDDLCYSYFSYLDKVSDRSRFGRREFNTLADLTTTILGITKTPAEQLAILSGARVAVTDTWDASDEILLLSPAPFKVYKVVMAKQIKLYSDYQSARQKDTLTAPAEPANYDAAFGLVREYAGYCTRIGIHKIIDEVIQEKIAATSPDANLNSALANTLDNVTNAINTKAKTAHIKEVSPISVDDALALHSYLTSPQTSPMSGYLALRGLKTNVDIMSESEKSGLNQLVDKVIASSPDIAQRVQESALQTQNTPPTVLSNSDLAKDAKFKMKDGSTIQIGETDADAYVHYKVLDSAGSPTGEDKKDKASDLLTKIDRKI